MRLRGLHNVAFKDKVANGWQGNDLSELAHQTQDETDLDVAQGQSLAQLLDIQPHHAPSSRPILSAVCGSHVDAPLYFIDRVYTNAPKQLQASIDD